MDIQVLKPEERNYTYSQSQQISMQTGNIGHLRADMDTNGEGFFSSWDDFRKDLKTQEFKDAFDEVINELRSPEGGIFRNRTALAKFCYSHPDSSFENGNNEYGIRVDSNEYAYLFRLNPNKGEYNIYCYPYRKDWLNHHLEKAQRGIRFIVTSAWGEKNEHTCRYIDDYHTEVGRNLLHICEFAERMEQNKATYEPKNKNETPDIKPKRKHKDHER